MVLTVGNAGDWISREGNLSGAASATLSFDYINGLVGAKLVTLEISNDDGASFSDVATFSSSINAGSGFFSTDISSSISSDTQIRFYFTSGANGIQTLSVDNVQIQYTVNEKSHGK